MSYTLFTSSERNEKKYTIADAVKQYKIIQTHRSDYGQISPDSQLAQRERRDPQEKITLWELNDLIYRAKEDSYGDLDYAFHRH